MSGRWERERGAWVEAHAREGTSASRRYQLLARADRRNQRGEHGLGAVIASDEVTAPLWRRIMLGEGKSPLKAITYAGAVVVGGIVSGVGVAVGYGVYQTLWLYSPRIGRLWMWPWAAAAAIGALVLWLLDAPFGVSIRFTWHFPSDTVQIGPWWAWVAWQLVIALAVTAWLIRAWGWAGVPKKAVIRNPRRKDGSFKPTPNHAKVSLDPERDVTVWDRIKTWMTDQEEQK